MGKLVNQESTLCNKTLQRVPFATYFGITPGLPEEQWKIHARRFAPNCPERSSH